MVMLHSTLCEVITC